MIIPSPTKILILPDFGARANAAAMTALKQAIEATRRFSVKIVDLLQMVHDEHPGEQLKDSEEIEMCARKLVALANDKTLEWDDIADDGLEDPLRAYFDDEEFYDSGFANCKDIKEFEEKVDKAPGRRLPVSISVTVRSRERHEPDALVVFGKSAMLAAGVKDKPILFIDPAYDSEWPWEEQHHACRDAASERCRHYIAEMKKPEDALVYFHGNETRRQPDAPNRYTLFTCPECSDELSKGFDHLAMIDETLNGKTEKLAETICEFADGKMDIPLHEIYAIVSDETKVRQLPEICAFPSPVVLNHASILGLEYGEPKADWQSGIKLRTAEHPYKTPLEILNNRNELSTLRDAVKKAADKLPLRKRILIVPDYFTPYNATNVIALRDQLRRMGYYVAIYVAGNSLEQSRRGLERRCKVKPFHLIAAIETGCLLASRVMNAPRVFVNPDWAAWEAMKQHLGNREEISERRGSDEILWLHRDYNLNDKEVNAAREMAMRSYIRRGSRGAYGWFSEDAIEDSRLTEEHMKRFNTSTYIPGLRLDTYEGIAVLARQIDNIMKTEDEN